MKFFEAKADNNKPNVKVLRYYQWNNTLKALEHYLCSMIKKFLKSGNGKFN